MKSRTFTPDPGLDPGLLRGWDVASSGRRHVLAQFWTSVTQEEAGERLAEMAGEVVAYIPNDAWIVAVDRRVLAADLASQGIRWIGPLEPRDRIDPTLMSERQPPALRDGGTATMGVSFFGQV